ncbi:carbohydrate ABC transporter permease [Ilumatobacter coccineus]|jgi:sn-glycerol 3-phosphate transport system permease protein|uniref:Putative ABC transporter permease protein n=1 Tax=Ilumatobacter coccineus (strain NBRC 103263 / KCTC 29153 / YM16-304) TaxID=1313172 RepID=A0A6C7E8L8_ILUCY|nr:sugar ABC transporter permease [Ilumatobacter coccineus]BAN04004.1 putative ABC transporter permease protein [Ilumatobacter coccineus YM16-304]
MERKRSWTWRDLAIAIPMLLPSALILGTFILYPLGRAVWLGQQRCNTRGDVCRSNGFDQYLDLFRSTEFQNALVVTAKFALISVPLGLVLGVGLAVLADKMLRGISFFRTVFSSTIATSVAVASLMWLFLLQPSVGSLANISWFQNLFPSVKNPGWLEDSGTALFAVALSSVWAGLGFTFILVTASLQSIPRELHEAAAVDGASGTLRFWKITVPLLGPTLLFIVIVLLTRAFQTYGEVDLLTNGGPSPQEATTTLAYLIYGDTPIEADAGLQAGSAVLLFVVLLALSALQVRGIGRRMSDVG